MWFLTEIEIKIQITVKKLKEICKKEKINIGWAWCKNKYLGLIVSDNDGEYLLKNYNQDIKVVDSQGIEYKKTAEGTWRKK